MPGHRRFLIGVICVIGLSARAEEAPSAAPQAPPPPQSSAARLAIAKYDKAVNEAEEAHRQALLKAKSALLEDLKPPRGLAVRHTDLNEANAIDAVVKRVSAEVTLLTANLPPLPGAADREVLGRRLMYTTWAVDGGGLKLTFNADRTFGRTDHGHFGKWAPLDGHTVAVLYEEGVIDLFRFDDALTKFKGTAWRTDHTFTGTPERQGNGGRR